MGWVPNFIASRSTASANLLELSGLSVLWLLWLIGCVISAVRATPFASSPSTQLIHAETMRSLHTVNLAGLIILLSVCGLQDSHGDDGIRLARMDCACLPHCHCYTRCCLKGPPQSRADDG